LAHKLAPFITRAGYHLDQDRLYRAIPIIQPRLVTLDDVIPVAGFLFTEDVTPNPAELVGDKLTPKESAKIARHSYQVLSSLPEINKDAAEPPLRSLVEQSGLKAGQVFGILRVAVTGQKNSPPLFECMQIIGKEKVLQRIKSAAEILENMPPPG
jgi:glutamyl-tRNA synthetase